MRDIIIIVNESEPYDDEEEDKLPGEEWMYDKDVNTGLY